ncbi:hypothetical protein ACFQXB_01290 [Plastorhodobacter daqingensis]|uniref:Uncharacterized protein n=1 Tax=Plastorhodobacter daqingensis TaxID=1387281 RepID=A0ABW2UHD1_9RHOB
MTLQTQIDTSAAEHHSSAVHDLPQAPLVMPKQVLEAPVGPLQRLIQMLAALRPAARAGH